MVTALFLYTHFSLVVFELGQDVQLKAVSLTSRPAATIHVVAQGQNQPKDILDG